MKNKAIKIFSYILLVLLLILVWVTQSVPSMGEAYARSVYPSIANVLSTISGIFPFSVGDLFITLSIAGLILYPFIAGFRKKNWKRILLNMFTYLAWVYVWFYLAWGLNYSQQNFYQRTHVPYAEYSVERFATFAEEYIHLLNESYVPIAELNKEAIHESIINQYKTIGNELGIHPPKGSPRVKTMLFSSFIAKTGTAGYMGPFFCEFNVNKHLTPSQYPSTYAHELAHYLGITSEAEANFYAYQVCTGSDLPEVRFCGYFSVLNYVLGNARSILSEQRYMRLVNELRTEIIDLSTENRKHWQALYEPTFSEVQNKVYDIYLKGNKIGSGRKNYSQVVGLLISYYCFSNNLD